MSNEKKRLIDFSRDTSAELVGKSAESQTQNSACGSVAKHAVRYIVDAVRGRKPGQQDES